VKRLLSTLTVAALAILSLAPAARAEEFGLHDFDLVFSEADGSPATQAGSHPYAMTLSFEANTIEGEKGKAIAVEAIKDVLVAQPPGFAGNQTPVPFCSTLDFLTLSDEFDHNVPGCADGSAVGIFKVVLQPPEGEKKAEGDEAPIYLLQPAPGTAAKLGFYVKGIPITADVAVSETPPYNIVGASTDISQLVEFFGAELTFWGNPASPLHDEERGACYLGGKSCPAGVPEIPFLTLPRACEGPLATTYAIDSWPNPGALLPSGDPDLSDPAWVTGEALTHDEEGNPFGFIGCGKLGFNPSITAQPTTKAARSPTGLDFSLDVNNEGLANPSGIADSDIEKTVVTLPEGFSTNPSIAEGLNVCTEAQLEAETAFSAPGAGCPNASKVGTLEVETPLLEGKLLKGSLFIAKPYENEFHSLLALYIVIKDPELGIAVKQAAKVTPDPVTGQLVTTTEDMPQLPFSHFRLHFREGARSPLASPPGCGSYDVKAELTPWSGGAPITTTSAFQIITGPNEGPCPSGGLPPFKPGLIAGTLNNAAGHFSPFNVRLFRSDSEQEITRFSIKLPPGLVGKLAGIPFCPDAAIAAAKARTGPHGGQEEIESPSCPAASQIGRTLAGAGVGPSLAYAPGKLYLAGPYHGSAISLVSITAAKVGPFDLGTVVVRLAFKINPETAEVFIDATGSDPIPHIIQGIPVHLRDIRAYADRPEFVLNPTDCTRTATASTVLGSGLNFASEADDNPITVSTPFQAADCAALPFKPKLTLRLVGGTKRGSHPALKAHLHMNGIGEAAIAYSQVTLPRSEFLDQSHIRTVCTRVQFNQGAVPGEDCPAGSVYGHAKAVTPILSEPLEGSVFLRSSEHQLPDLVAALHNGEINVNLVGRVDSVKGGRIRNTFEVVPDAPVSEFTLTMQGADKGLLVNSTNLCKGTHRVIVNFTGHNGKVSNTRPALQAKCPKAHRKHRRHQRRAVR
jgi:hypothetical protein